MSIQYYSSVAGVLADLPETSVDWQYAIAAAYEEYGQRFPQSLCVGNTVRWFVGQLPELSVPQWRELVEGAASFAQMGADLCVKYNREGLARRRVAG